MKRLKTGATPLTQRRGGNGVRFLFAQKKNRCMKVTSKTSRQVSERLGEYVANSLFVRHPIMYSRMHPASSVLLLLGIYLIQKMIGIVSTNSYANSTKLKWTSNLWYMSVISNLVGRRVLKINIQTWLKSFLTRATLSTTT